MGHWQFDIAPAVRCFGCGGFALGDFGGHEGQHFDEVADLALQLGDHPVWEPPAALRGNRLDQPHQGDSEAFGWGEGWKVVHALFLQRVKEGGQAKKVTCFGENV